jgi:hypothetical protein
MEKQEVVPVKNAYLEDALQAQVQVAQELKRASRPVALRARRAESAALSPEVSTAAGDHGVEVRVTGWWRWKTVIVPPNVYVVHTRRGRQDPVHMGLGISFGFNPYTDAYLVVPATMQTIVITARCICKERQGIVVQAYVQWIVEDIRTAYRKLDFSDVSDPMRIVSVQLREQAEAAIKDKVATMSIDDVLTDKQPIIEELTHRLRAVAEGKDNGLGLKIVTVQIKEAIVASQTVWENLQKPFRAEQDKVARLAVIENENVVLSRELADRRATQLAQLSVDEDIARAKHLKDAEAFSRQQAEQERRHLVEQEAERKRIGEKATTDKLKREKDLEVALRQMELDVDRMKGEMVHLDNQVRLDDVQGKANLARTLMEVERVDREHAALHARDTMDIASARARREVENLLSAERLQERLLEALPAIVEKLPVPDKVERVHVSTDGAGPDGLTSLVGLLSVVRTMLKGDDVGETRARVG